MNPYHLLFLSNYLPPFSSSLTENVSPLYEYRVSELYPVSALIGITGCCGKADFKLLDLNHPYQSYLQQLRTGRFLASRLPRIVTFT